MDIVERRRRESRIDSVFDTPSLSAEAADEITRRDDEIDSLRDENARLRLEVDAWRERFKGYEYRRQDDVVALKLHDYGPGEPAWPAMQKGE